MDEYLFLHAIGKGSYGNVYKAFNVMSKRTVAIKQIRLDNDEEYEMPLAAVREMSLFKQLNHPNIVSMDDIIFDNGVNVFLVFEFLPMDLHAYIKRKQMNPMVVKSFLYQITQAIVYCHMNSILHSELRPQNILVDPEKGNVKVTGFGGGEIDQHIGTIPTDDKVANLWYRAPELLLGANISSYSIDIWPIGCIFAEMTCGDVLFEGDSEIGQLFTIFRVLTTPTQENWPGVELLPNYNTNFPKWTKYCLKENTMNIDDVGYDLLHKLLKYNTETRISAEVAIQHVYFDDIRGQLPSSSYHVYY